MKKLFLSLILILVIAAQPVLIKAQTIKFRHFGTDKGLCHPFVYTLNQDKGGYIWAGTGDGLCRFDGTDFTKAFSGDSVSSAYGACSFRDAKGNLWFGHSDGSITFWNGQKPKKIHLPSSVTSTINSITGTEDGTIYAASQNNGLIVIDKDWNVHLMDTLLPGQLLYSLLAVQGNALLVGTGDGLYIAAINASGLPEKVVKMNIFPLTRVLAMTAFRGDNRLLVGTEDMGVFIVQGSGADPAVYTLTDLGTEWGLQYSGISAIMQDEAKNLWFGTQGEGLYELVWSESAEKWIQKLNFNEQNGLSYNYVRTILQDREGIIWIGTYGQGLDALTGSALQFYSYDKEVGKNIKGVASMGNTVWVAGSKSILRLTKSKTTEQLIYKMPALSSLDEITTLFADGGENLWIGTKLSGVYKIAKGSSIIKQVFNSASSLKNQVNDINGRNDTIFIGTLEGLVYLNTDGKILGMRTMSEQLPNNQIHQVFISRKGKVLIATKTNGLYDIYANKTIATSFKGEIDFTAIAEDPQGNFWASTNGSGVLCFESDTVLQFNTKNGLASNYVYSLICDKFGMVWAGHRLAISRISSTGHTVAVFEKNSGINSDCNPNAMAVTPDGVLLTGTTDGLISYDARLEQNTGVAPALNIVSVRINDELFSSSQPIKLKYSDYKLKIEFIGLYFRSPDRVKYQYMLKGYDKEWVDASSTTAMYPVLRDGKYSFIVKACNEDGQCTDETVLLQMEVRKPFWKLWWVWVIIITILVVSVRAFIKYREAQLLERNRMLEEEVNRRTMEVVQQKEVIESQNRDIMDSIEYAKRIQESVLPSASKLQGIFSGSFIFYQPKATVSGDFYWFDKVGRDRFIIVCADSTGHGVPGAFMSMMGTTLVKDICYRSELESPSEMLAVLDREIGARLNQNLEGERANDGMDILICEINLENYYMRVASAMRPYILYQNGEQVYVQGSRSSIGGNIETKEDKIFEEKEFQLTKGDIIYMFSDGYTDQFGGPMGKKYKMVRLRNLLSHIYQMPMTEQRNFVMSNFNLWKMDFNQVDDVLFMGIQI